MNIYIMYLYMISSLTSLRVLAKFVCVGVFLILRTYSTYTRWSVHLPLAT